VIMQNRRFHHGMRKIRRLIDEGYIGKVTTLNLDGSSIIYIGLPKLAFGETGDALGILHLEASKEIYSESGIPRILEIRP
jgi:hypothetical protein